MDVQMPELFGHDVAVALGEEYGLRCPIYLLSSLNERELQRHARDANLDGYLSKSDGMEALVRRVEEILAG